MLSDIVLQVVVTGICVLVPQSSITPTVVHVTCPRADAGANMVPPHHAYLEVSRPDVAPGSDVASFSYQAGTHEEAVYLLHSDEISIDGVSGAGPSLQFETAPAPDVRSLDYVVRLAQIDNRMKAIRPEYLDIKNHPDLVAARMELTGGTLHANFVDKGVEWEFKPDKYSHPVMTGPVAQEVATEIRIPGNQATVRLVSHEDPAALITRTVHLQPVDSHCDGSKDPCARIRLGDSPMEEIIAEAYADPAQSTGVDHHFSLYYPMFDLKPGDPVLPVIVRGGKKMVRGGSVNCIPAMAPAMETLAQTAKRP